MNYFHWLVALRYLRMRAARSAKIHFITLGLALVVVGVFGADYWLAHTQNLRLLQLHDRFEGLFRLGKLASLVLAVLVETFILLVRRLTIFTTISTYGLFLGSGALVIVLSVMSGFENDLRHKILGANAHIVVTRPNKPFTDYAAVLDQVSKLPGVIGASPYLSSEVFISSSTNLSVVDIKGIDPATVAKTTELPRQIETGSLDYLTHPEKLRDVRPPFLDDLDLDEPPKKPGAKTHDLLLVEKPNEPKGKKLPKLAPEQKPEEPRRILPGVIIGRELAKNLRLFVGDDVSIVSPLGGIGPTGPIPKSKPFRVAGIFFSGMFEYDSKDIYLSIPAAQRFLGDPGEVTGLELKVRDPDKTGPIVERIKAMLGGQGYQVRDWQEINRSLFSALKLEKIAMFIVLCFIILVAAFSIIANGIMLVLEKGREIAILKSMGASDRAILVVFVLLGLYMGGLGTVAGIVTGIAACLALAHFGISLDPDVYYMTQLPVKLSAGEISAVAAAAILIAILATLYPAWVAARLRPVEGLREGTR